MTEEAPRQQNGELDADLINYEADDVEAVPDMEWPSSDGKMTTAAVGDDSIDLNAAGTTTKFATATTIEINEIDWEDHDNIGGNVKIDEDGALAGLDAGAGVATSLEMDTNGSISALTGTGDVAALDAGADAAEFDQGLDADIGGSLNTNGIGETTAEGVMEHEITYDEDEEVTPTKDPEEDLIDYESYPDDLAEHVEAGAEAQDEAEEDAEEDAEDEGDTHVVAEDQTGDAVGVGDQSDDQSEEEEASPDTSGECPDITVNYQNAEFPLFHGQKGFGGSNGFFDDQSILDYTMDQLLGKFRQEIADDLGPQDEVVLQIDEMGLEYAESTHRDHITGATLRQLHDIFEQLAKNQDPDASRTLYTNLLIRPHPAKRLELLIEEAFNGKGLDDVIYSFQTTTDGRPVAEHGGDVDMYGDSSEGDEEGSAGQDDEQGLDENQEQDDEESTSHDGETDEHADNDRTSTNYAQDYDAEDDEVDDENENAEDEMVEINDQGQLEGYSEHEFDENDHGLDAMNQPQEDTVADDAYAHANFESEHYAAEGGDDGDENAGFDLLHLIDEDAAAPEPGQTDKVNTSATATLNGDGENEINYEEDDDVDVGVDVDAGVVPEAEGQAGAAAETVTGEAGTADAFDEIDWREPEEADGGLKESVSGSAKRPHSEVDVELGLDDENDVKRRRS